MKKISYLLFGAAALALASCSQEPVENAPVANGNGGNVQLTISLPEDLATRAANDGKAATCLTWAIYDADNGNSLLTWNFDDDAFANGSLTTTVDFNLGTGKSYFVALFAQSLESVSRNVYKFDPSLQTIVFNYKNMTNDGMNVTDAYDCFFNNTTITKVGTSTAPAQVSVTLYRPIAQINWGTSDLKNTAIVDPNYFGQDAQYLQSSLSVDAYTVFDVIAGDVKAGTQPEEVTLPFFKIPYALGAFPVSGYDYIAMQYLLAPKTDSYTADFNLVVNNADNLSATMIENKVVVANAPIQANYRTNIYGALLTDDLQLTVTKDPNWYTPDFEDYDTPQTSPNN